MTPMTHRERFVATALARPTDRPPYFFFFGPWVETLERWRTEGLGPDALWSDGFGFDPGIAIIDEVLGYCPKFRYEVLREDGDDIVFRDELGIVQMSKKSGTSIPRYLEYPVRDRDDWRKLKKRLDPDDPARFPPDWKEKAAALDHGDKAVQLGGFPYGLFGTLRDMMGVETLLVTFYDDPELIRDMMDTLTDFWLAVYAKVLRDVRVDVIHLWEDMSGKTGSLISPAMIREFMLPNYRRIRDFADRNGIPALSLDTDGDCTELVPLFLDGGIDLLLPFEVAAGSDILAYRREYPGLGIMGGIDKREVALGQAAIDRELARVAPMFERPGYFPMLDHLIHPEISWDDFRYFTEQVREMCRA